MSSPSILFIGNYLSGKKGTTALAYRLKEKLTNAFAIDLISSKKNKLLRLLSMLWHSAFHPAKVMVIDVFSGQAFWFAYVCSWVSKLLRKRKIILVFRGGKFASYVESHTSYVHQLIARADSLQTPSLFLQEALGQHSIAVHYLPNFVNLEQFTFLPHPPSTHKLLWIRSFAPIYQPQLAIEILAKVRSTFPDATLTMVGPDDGLLATCKQLAMKLNLAEHIHFTGPVAHNELASYYHQHDAYLNTTQYESFGNALMEAASCGIPMVSTSVGEIPYLWKQNESIVLIQDGQALSFAAAIQSLWTNDALRQHIIQQARKQSERFAWDAIRAQWVDLLKPGSNANS